MPKTYPCDKCGKPCRTKTCRDCKTGSAWSPKQDALFRKYHGVKPRPEIARLLKKSTAALTWRASQLKLPGLRTYWDEADIAALIELSPTCTDAQIGEYMNRTTQQVAQQRSRLRGKGIQIDKPNAQHLIPFAIPCTAILLAKTCTTCGKIRDAKYFRKTLSKAGYDPVCKVCHKHRQRSLGTNRQKAERLQQLTIDQAQRTGQPYTSAELDELLNTKKSDLELALSLSRTYYAVCTMRSKLGVRDDKRGLYPDQGHWEIDFPEAMTILIEHYRTIGTPVPEELWEWTDEAKAS